MSLRELQERIEKRRKAWEQRIRRLYGITPEDVAYQWEAQGGKCAVCEQPLETKTWVIDHSHKTGRFRGILCNWCNHRVVSMMERGGSLRAGNAMMYLGWVCNG